MDSSGNLYGTTSQGGAHGMGTVFKTTSTGTTTTLYSFSGTVSPADGATPACTLVRDSSGNLYGTTSQGGAHGMGTVFKTTSTGTTTTLYSFSGTVSPADGATPFGGLVIDSSGNFYGTTSQGGAHTYGTVFKTTSTGTTTTLYSFSSTVSPADGATPYGGLVLDSSGNLYGTTSQGGAHTFGTVFKTTSTGTTTTLYSFSEKVSPADGGTPFGSLVRDSSGNLYGTTSQGGAHTYGTVFKTTSTGTTTTLYSFSSTVSPADGATPLGGLVMDSSGNLYGTTSQGGAHTYGTVFKLVP
jgi:uncharacterized repeat protein (TIGR03803 family)